MGKWRGAFMSDSEKDHKVRTIVEERQLTRRRGGQRLAGGRLICQSDFTNR